MRPVGGRKSVIHKGIGQPGQRSRHRRVVLFLALVEAGILQQQHIAIGHGGDGGFRFGADAVISETHRAAKRFSQRHGHGLEAHFRHAHAFWPVEMAAHHHAGTLLRQLANGGGEALDAGHVGDAAIAHRQVQVGAKQHALAMGIEVIEGAKRHGCWLSCCWLEGRACSGAILPLVASAKERFQTGWGVIRRGAKPCRQAPPIVSVHRKTGTASSSGRSGSGTSMRTVLGSTPVPASSQ